MKEGEQNCNFDDEKNSALPFVMGCLNKEMVRVNMSIGKASRVKRMPTFHRLRL